MRRMPFIETQAVPEWRERLFPPPQGATSSRISAALRLAATLEGLREDLLNFSLEDFGRGGQRRGPAARSSDKALLRSPILMRIILEGKMQFGIAPIVTASRIERQGDSLFADLLAAADPGGEIDASERLDLRRHFEGMAKGRWGKFLPVIAGLHRMGVEGRMKLSQLGSEEGASACMIWDDTVIVEGELSLAQAVCGLAAIGGEARSLMFIKPLDCLASIDARRLETIDERKSLLDVGLAGLRFVDARSLANARTIAAAVVRG